MNPQDPQKNEFTAGAPQTPDDAAMQRIDAIESEAPDPSVVAAESIVNLPGQEPTPQQPVVPVAPRPVAQPQPQPQPASSVAPTPDDPQLPPSPAPIAPAPAPQPATTQPAAGPQKRKPSKVVTIALLAAVVILAVLAVIYVVNNNIRQAEQQDALNELIVPTETGGDFPGGGDNEVEVDGTAETP